MKKLKEGIKKIQEVANKLGFAIDLVECREEIVMPNGKVYPATASIQMCREIMVWIDGKETVYTLISREGDTVKHYVKPSAALKAAWKLAEIDGVL